MCFYEFVICFLLICFDDDDDDEDDEDEDEEETKDEDDHDNDHHSLMFPSSLSSSLWWSWLL